MYHLGYIHIGISTIIKALLLLSLYPQQSMLDINIYDYADDLTKLYSGQKKNLLKL